MRIPTTLQAALLAATLIFSAVTGAQPVPLTVHDAMVRIGLPPAAVGLHVVGVDDGTVLSSLNPGTPFNPASTMKLVTSNAALETLGPAFTWKTEAYATGALVDGVLHGNLVIKGSGDPKLVLENFWLFLRRIRAAGVRDIRGDLLLDRSAFDALVHDPAEFDGDPLRPYNVGPDALLLNFKSLAFRFTPDATRNTAAVIVEPPLAAYPVYPPQLSDGPCNDWRRALRATIDGNGARFAGRYPAACGQQTWYVHPHPMTHTQYFDLGFRRVWADLGGYLRGTVREEGLPTKAWPIAQWESAPLADLIRDINKYSNNVMARQLLLTIAREGTGLPGNTDRGGAVVRHWLGTKGIDAPELAIDNGSGLSRSGSVSALTLAQMLVAAYRGPVMPEFISSLPLVGHDGTMRRRMAGDPVTGRAHIKTGRLEEVRAIAGYVLAASGKRYVVVCLINHARVERAQEVQDALLQWVYERG